MVVRQSRPLRLKNFLVFSVAFLAVGLNEHCPFGLQAVRIPWAFHSICLSRFSFLVNFVGAIDNEPARRAEISGYFSTGIICPADFVHTDTAAVWASSA
ncbi:hypothetical protein DFH06DRAFT_511547 [Mycena polygramma]|nr:hypothetical protein DFH06DRAFT_511547 [Mycena polygramma]